MTGVAQGRLQVVLDNQDFSALLHCLRQDPSQSTGMEIAALPAVLEALQAAWDQSIVPREVSLLNTSSLGAYQACRNLLSAADELSCVVILPIDDLHGDVDGLHIVQNSHQLLRPTPLPSGEMLACQPYWTTLIRGKNLTVERVTPGRDALLLCHPDLLVGRPLQRCWGGGARVLVLGYSTPMDMRGQLDHCWSFGDGRALLAGWFTDNSPEATIQLIDTNGDMHLLPLGSARLDRPDVSAVLGLLGDGRGFGFLTPIKLQGITQVCFGSQTQQLNAVPLQRLGDVEAALDCLVDACHWGTTPPDRLGSLLDEGLGQALRWLKTLSFSRNSATPLHSIESLCQRVVLEVGHDRQLVRWRLHQLQPLIRTGGISVQVRLAGPFHTEVEAALPAWLVQLGQQSGVDLHPFQPSGSWIEVDPVLAPLPNHWFEAGLTGPRASRRSWLQVIEAWGRQL